MGDYSVYIVLPRSAIKELGWRKGQNVVARRSGQRIVINPSPPGHPSTPTRNQISYP